MPQATSGAEPVGGEPGQSLDLLAVVGRPLVRRAWPALAALAGFAAGWFIGRRTGGPGRARISQEIVYRTYRC